MTGPAAFDPLRLFRELNEAGVRYVVIGALAGRLLGSPTLTRDLDICHATDSTNLAALVNVLHHLNARLRETGRPVPFRLDVRSLARAYSFTFTTDAGPGSAGETRRDRRF